MDVVARLDEIRAAVNVLEHPFYERWSAGELSPGELDRYAGEYRHAVHALAHTSARAADRAEPGCVGSQALTSAERAELRRHAEEEAAHEALWEQFQQALREATAGSLSSSTTREDESELAQTRACVRAWGAGEDLLEHLAVLYAIEAGQPEISETKLTGLVGHYGFTEEGPATEYFRVHRQLDVEHARQARALIAQLMSEVEDPDAQGERMLARAHDALRGNWLLLDGVEGAPYRGAQAAG